MESKFSMSFAHSPNPEMPDIRMNLEDEFSQEEQKSSDSMSVYARIRPMLQREEDAGYKECIAAIDDETVRAVFPTSSAKFKNTNHNGNEILEDFKYSRAFGPETGQFPFFEQTIMKTMQSFIDGKNCLIFSYGITNSGKTYTLQGTEENPGIIILALRLFFSSIEHQLFDGVLVKPDKFADLNVLKDAEKVAEITLKEDLLKFYSQEVVNKSAESSTSMTKSFAMTLCDCFSDNFKLNVETTLPPEEMEAAQSAQVMKMLSKETADQQTGKCNIWISFIEIYNEYIYDLLQPNVFPRKKLQLAEDQNGDVYVKGAREVYVSNVDEALKLLHIGRKSLRIACTKLNYQSSRSHCIYIVKVVRLNEDCDSFRINRLSFCDLAGSERASKSQTSGMRLKEACYINTSLLVLGRCLEQLRQNQNSKDKKQMIPFRESKLTRLFAGHFMGKGQAVMIANASPCEYTFDETLNVLKFSAVAKELILNDTYMKMTSSSLQSISSQWSQSRAQVSHFSLDQSSDMENSLLEDIQTKDEMIEKLLDLADSLRSNLEQEKKEKANLEYTIRQEVYRDYSTYSDELLARQKEVFESQIEDLKEHYNKRLEDLDKRKNETIRELRDQIAEYEATTDESFQSVDVSLSSSYRKYRTPSKMEAFTDGDKKTDSIMKDFKKEADGEMPSDVSSLSKELEEYMKENKILKLDLCSLKNQLEMNSQELLKSSEEVTKLQNEYKNKAASENISILKCDHIPEIEKLSADLISLKEDLNLVASERDTTKEELERISSLLQECEKSKSATEEKCLHLDSKLQESLNVLEEFEIEVSILKSEKSVADNLTEELMEEVAALKSEKSVADNLTEELMEEVATLKSEKSVADNLTEKLMEEKEKLRESVFSLSEDIASSSELIEKLKSEKAEIEKNFAASEKNLKIAEEKNIDLEKKLVETTNAINELKSKHFALESECEVYKSETSSLSANYKLLEEKIKTDEKQEDLCKKLEEATQSILEQTAKILSLEAERDAYKKEASDLFTKCKLLEEQLMSNTQNWENSKSEKEAVKKTCDELIKKLKSDLVNSENHLSEIKMKLEESESVIENKEIAFNQLKNEHNSLQQKCILVENKLSALEDNHGEKCYLELSDLKQKLEDAQKLLTEQEALTSTLKSDNTKLLEDIKTLKDELDNKSDDTFASEAEISFGSEDVKELDTYKMRLSGKESECETLNNKYNDVLNKHHELEEKIATISKELELATNDIKNLEEEKVFVEEASEKLKTDLEIASSDLRQKEADLESLGEECAQYKEEISELKKDKAELLNKLDAAKAEISELENKHLQTITNLQSLDSTLKSVQQGLEKTEEEKKLMKENSSTMDKNELLLKEEIEELNVKIGEMSSKVTELQDQNSNLIAELKVRDEQALKHKETISAFEEKVSSLSQSSALASEELSSQLKKEIQENLETEENVTCLEEKKNEVTNLQIQCERYQEEISQLEKENGELKNQTSDLVTKLDATNKEQSDLTNQLESLKSKLSNMQAIEEENKILEEKYSALFENNNAANMELTDLKEKFLQTTTTLQTLETKLSCMDEDLQKAAEEKRILEEKYSSLIESNAKISEKEIEYLNLRLKEASSQLKELQNENSGLRANLDEKASNCQSLSKQLDMTVKELNLLKKDNEDKEKSIEDCAELIKVLELNEFKATEKINSLNDDLSKQLNSISDMERQIREKETAIFELEKALDESQKRFKEINIENQKLLRQRNDNSYEERSKKKAPAYKLKEESDNKENADKSVSSKEKQLKRNSSTTSEESEKSPEVKKTRRALRARQADSTTTYENDSDFDEKPKAASRKRKSDEEFMPSKKVQKETSKGRKIPSRRGVKDKKEENLRSVQDENMSPVQKIAAYVGSKIRSAANTVASMPSPRMTRGRKKLFNVDSVGTPTKKWKY